MIFVLSPAKSLDFESPLPLSENTQPELLAQSAILIEQLKELSPMQIQSLMKISPALATLNAERFKSWKRPFSPNNARQAVFAFNGDVYEGLDAYTLPVNHWQYAQNHLRILSGLYGVLRPLDLIQPYRLEMGTKLNNKGGKNLYQFWGNTITENIIQQINITKSTALINLASEEYFKSIHPKQLRVPIITPIFEDWAKTQYKVIGFYAKRARGLMARYAITHCNPTSTPEALKAFNSEGYYFCSEHSDNTHYIFRRKL
ncbi:MAG: peroxide stress protein YaaA [Pseudomonadota bacterium]